jgi:hypothetical protein
LPKKQSLAEAHTVDESIALSKQHDRGAIALYFDSATDWASLLSELYRLRTASAELICIPSNMYFSGKCALIIFQIES